MYLLFFWLLFHLLVATVRAFRPGFDQCAFRCVELYKLFMEDLPQCAVHLYYACHDKCFCEYKV